MSPYFFEQFWKSILIASAIKMLKKLEIWKISSLRVTCLQTFQGGYNILDVCYSDLS